MFICFQFILNEGSIHNCLYYNMIQYVNMIDYFPDHCYHCILYSAWSTWRVENWNSRRVWERAASIASRFHRYLKFGQHTVTCLPKVVYQIPNCDKYEKLCSSNPSCLTKRSLIKSPPFTFTQHLHFINRFQQSYLLVVNHEHDNQQQQ